MRRNDGEKGEIGREWRKRDQGVMEKIRTHKDLRVFQLSFELSMEIFELSKSFPVEEKYSLTDQIRRSSRSVPTNISEAFRKRRYPKYLVAKLSDTEGEAAKHRSGWILLFPVNISH